MMVVHCVYCGCCEVVCAGGCGLGLYLYKFGHSCACDTRIIGLWWLTCLQWPSLPRAALFDHSCTPFHLGDQLSSAAAQFITPWW